MSGTAVPAAITQAFDGFLLKPFSIEDLRAAIAGQGARRADSPTSTAPLNLDIYNAFRAGMPREQLAQLYAMSLDDAERRIGLMRRPSRQATTEPTGARHTPLRVVAAWSRQRTRAHRCPHGRRRFRSY